MVKAENLRPITLQELLDSRDARVEYQKQLAREFPRASLICFTVILPGPVKRDTRSLRIAAAGVEAILRAFACSGEDKVLYQEEKDLVTGFEAYFAVSTPPAQTKRLCCQIEDAHPLGRLMDIDVIVRDPDCFVRPLSRKEIGLQERPCLVCGRPARECMRVRRHTAESLSSAIEAVLRRFIN